MIFVIEKIIKRWFVFILLVVSLPQLNNAETVNGRVGITFVEQTESKEQVKSDSTMDSAISKVKENQRGKKQLPQTNESFTWSSSIVGCFVLNVFCISLCIKKLTEKSGTFQTEIDRKRLKKRSNNESPL